MDTDLLLWTLTLIFFTAWLSWLGGRLNAGLKVIDGSDQGVQEIGEALGEVIVLLQQLPDWLKQEVQQYVPEFHMNTSPFAPLIEAVVKNLSGEQPLKTYSAPDQDKEGRFIAPKEE
jgi:hypothetical protein